jgi:hypothetical protein
VKVLFVHGMGRTSASGWLLLRQLRRAGHETATFGYTVSTQGFDDITKRLAAKVGAMCAAGEVALVGHSLGGVLLRAAMHSLTSRPRLPRHLFLLGSPVGPTRMAQHLRGNVVFRACTGDCGQLLGSDSRMSLIGEPPVPTTGIAGTKGLAIRRGPFGAEPNDGVVSVSEVSAPWLTDQVFVPVVHTLLPASRRVGVIIIERLGQDPQLASTS